MQKKIRFLNTIKYLKIKQIYYRVFYLIRQKIRIKLRYEYAKIENIKQVKLILQKSIYSYQTYKLNSFSFLNLQKQFTSEIDWNYSVFGKLWTYNLSYFDFLHQKEITKDEGVEFILSFIESDTLLKDAKESFPISLRGINWIKFLSLHSISNSKIDNVLYNHYCILLDNLEYHLLGNHLLENGFSLLFGAYYFENEKLYVKAKEILDAELKEQILNDGAHFELSPMYHQIMLFRVLDCINLVENNAFKNHELLELLKKKASLMLGWLENISYENGEVPLLNDSAHCVAPTTKNLLEYAKRLNVVVVKKELKDSGYRKVKNSKYECIVDIGQIGPDYIPGHAHSDTFNFVVQKDNQPFIVDTGLSTYETNERRTKERSTSSHNTVEVNTKDQSEVWGGFRVANRAYITQVEEKNNSIRATHDGYKKDNIFHTRKWVFEDDKIIIEDSLSKEADAVARVHFHPDVTKEKVLNSIVTDSKVEVIEYKYAPEFNKLVNAFAIEIKFRKNLKVEIKL